MTNNYEKSVDALMKDVKDLLADIKGLVHALQGKAKDRVDSSKESLHEYAAQRLEQIRDAADVVGRSCQKGLKECAAKIGEHPLASTLTALGVGMVGGLLLRRRR